jgi:CubicO group peptidase (beta-lactamase class C family)
MLKLFSVLLLLPFVTNAQKNAPLLLDKYMQGQEKVYDFSGDVLVAQKGQIIYKKAFGFAIREWNIPNTIESRFRIGSITKQFTAVAILQLADNGKLSLEDKLSKYFPDFPKGDSVTIHMLLNHTSGIKDYTSLPNFRSLEPLPYQKIL